MILDYIRVRLHCIIKLKLKNYFFSEVRNKMASRKLPQTPSLLKNENAALKNRVQYLEELLEYSYGEIRGLVEKTEKLKRENEKLKREKKRYQDEIAELVYERMN